MGGLKRRSARVRSKANRVNRVQEIVKIARRQRTVTLAMVEVHSMFQAKSSTLETPIKTKLKTTTLDAILKDL